MRLIVLALLAFLTVGCATVGEIDIANIEASSAIALADLRPELEKEDKTFSLAITSESYGTYRRGDRHVKPAPVRILQHRIYEKLKTNAPEEVKVHHLVVYENSKSELRKASIGGALGGLIGGAIAGSTQNKEFEGVSSVITEDVFNSDDDEYKRALYTEAANPGKTSVYIIYVDAELDGKRTVTRTMFPVKQLKGKQPKGKQPKGQAESQYGVAVEAAITFFLDQYS